MQAGLIAALLVTVVPPSDAGGIVPEPPVVARAAASVTLAGPVAARTELLERLEERLARLELDVIWDQRERIAPREVIYPSAVDRSHVARIYVDLGDPAAALVYVADRGHERLLVRVVPLEQGFDEVAREQVGLIVYGAVEALMAGAEIGVHRREVARDLDVPEPAPAPVREREPEPAPAPESAPEPTAAPELEAARTSPVWAALGVAYGVGLWRAEVPMHGPRLRLALGGAAGRISLGAYAELEYLAHRSVGAPVLPTRIAGVAARLGGTLRGPVAPRVSLQFSVGGGTDLLWIRGQNAGGQWTPIPMVELAGGPGFALGPRLALEIEPWAAVDLVDTRLLTTRSVVIFDPWRVRPGLRVRLRFQFFGSPQVFSGRGDRSAG